MLRVYHELIGFFEHGHEVLDSFQMGTTLPEMLEAMSVLNTFHYRKEHFQYKMQEYLKLVKEKGVYGLEDNSEELRTSWEKLDQVGDVLCTVVID